MGQKNLLVKLVCVFTRHYGFKIEVSKLGREVKKVAILSEKFVEERLTQSREKANVNPSQTTEKILLELDGCHLRTGVKIPGDKTGLTKIRKIKKSSRKVDWVERVDSLHNKVIG